MQSLAELFGFSPVFDVFKPYLTPVAGPRPLLSDVFTPYLTPIGGTTTPPPFGWPNAQSPYDSLPALARATFPSPVGGSSFQTVPPAADVGRWRPDFGATDAATYGDTANLLASSGFFPQHWSDAVDPSSPEPSAAERPGNEQFAAPYGSDSVTDGPIGFVDPSGNFSVDESNGRDRLNARMLQPQTDLAGYSGGGNPFEGAVNVRPDRINANGLAGGSAVISDADPEVRIPGARYAQYRPRGGRRGPGAREISPPEENRLLLYDAARKTLQELDPNNPRLLSLSSRTWVPNGQDIKDLNAEIAKIRPDRAVVYDLERHHNLPQEFNSKFKACGIDPEEYVMYMARSAHRLLPNGLHTGSEHWNKQWDRFFETNQKPSPDQVLEQLNKMFKQQGW